MQLANLAVANMKLPGQAERLAVCHNPYYLIYSITLPTGKLGSLHHPHRWLDTD